MSSLELMCAVGLLAAASCRSAASIGDSSAARLVVTEDGREVAMRWLALTACDSSNSEFALCFEPRDGTGADHDYVPQCGAWEPTTYGGHAVAEDSRNHGWHHFAVVAAADVELIAAATGLEPARYVERGVSLVADCSLDRTSITADDGVRVSWVIENQGANTVRYTGGGGRGVFRSPCSFELRRDGVAVAHRARLGGGGGHRVSSPSELAPGARIRRHERVEWEFSLDEPGDYQLSARFWLPVVEPVPRYSRADACPVVAASCGEVFDASLAFSVRR